MPSPVPWNPDTPSLPPSDARHRRETPRRHAPQRPITQTNTELTTQHTSTSNPQLGQQHPRRAPRQKRQQTTHTRLLPRRLRLPEPPTLTRLLPQENRPGKTPQPSPVPPRTTPLRHPPHHAQNRHPLPPPTILAAPHSGTPYAVGTPGEITDHPLGAMSARGGNRESQEEFRAVHLSFRVPKCSRQGFRKRRRQPGQTRKAGKAVLIATIRHDDQPGTTVIRDRPTFAPSHTRRSVSAPSPLAAHHRRPCSTTC
ncbi:hypothetical protein FHR84_000820 [Actinopolyspora biskrensis]|uniref:Uncharacterized protein n=1 Tax=Actinopolyspora biskrensis TaxID=1470178 RepID=A0A852Z1I6_9ACTN|nr:hypothetical protein [Actinopolyspora biskrensis]